MAEKFAYSRYDSILAISRGVQESLSQYFIQLGVSTKTELAENGIADNFFESSRKYSKNPTRVVSIGSLREIKQHHLAIQAVAKLDSVTLKIAGDGALKETLQNEINQLKVNDRVQLLGNVSDIRSLLLDSDLALSTSKYEGFGIAMGEAQATGIPVVGPNVEGLREVVINEKTGLLYDHALPETIAQTIQEALSPAWYPLLCSNTKLHAAHFTMENSFNTHMDIYKRILNHN